MKSVLLAFAVFSRIPVPHAEFKEENMRHLMAVFPLVGVVMGLAVILWDILCGRLGLGPLPRGAGFVLLPLALNGGIHMDGFSDTVDALASHGDAETKQRVLRDPHVGSFAVLALCAYFLAFTALASEIFSGIRHMACFALAFVLSRAVAGVAVLSFPGSPSSSMSRHFRSAAKGSSLRLLTLTLVCLGVSMTCLGGPAGFAAFALPLLLLARWKQKARQQFGGMSGDLAGYLIQMCELWSLAALVVLPRLVGRWYPAALP